MDDEEIFKLKLDAAFRVEAEEHLQVISSLLLELEKTPGAGALPGMVESIYREAHTLKGAARSVNRGEIESICQTLEDIFSDWKTRGRAAHPEANPCFLAEPESFDALSGAVDALTTLLAAPDRGSSPQSRDVLKQLRQLKDSAAPPQPPPMNEAPPSPAPVEYKGRARARSASRPRVSTPWCARPRRCSI